MQRILPEKIWVIPNALSSESLAAFEVISRHIPDSSQKIKLVTTANLISYKGHKFLIQALERLCNEGLPLELNLIGEGPERESLEQASSNLPVNFLGHIGDVQKILRMMDIFVLPSLTEGMSNAVMEAMLMGLPCIVTNVGGNLELIGDAGIIVPPADSSALAIAIKELALDSKKRYELGIESKARAIDLFNPEVLAQRHLELFGEIRTKKCAV